MTSEERRPLLTIAPSLSVAKRLHDAAEDAAAQKTPLLTGYSSRKTRKGVRKFYDYQTYLVECYEKDSELLEKGHIEHEANSNEVIRKRRVDGILAKSTFVVNILLLVAKAFASYLSNSLSVISTVIDSAMDITSGLVIWLAVRAIEKTNPYEYPRGRTRLEPISIVIVSIIMGVANLMMIIQSVQSVINNTVDPHVDIATFAILGGGTVVKAVLLVICIRQKTSNSAVLAMDQRNDIITNIVALAGALIGNHLWLYADPLGAVLVCTFIAGSWFKTAGGQIPLLSGRTASPEFINRIIRVAISHDERIICLDTLMVYHFGNEFLVELHVVMEPTMSLKEAHDVAEPLQIKLERLPYVERAFVHCDWRCDGAK
uniref:Cation efflux protein cytoplasmic domain-containing protein n=1 Tax=Plectus sambesii TaxID=2011161 RepID=A0A914W9I3_9BILA